MVKHLCYKHQIANGDWKMHKYIIVTQSAFGQVFLRKSDTYSGRFVVEKDLATQFDDIGPAKEWLAEQETTMNRQIFERCKIIEHVPQETDAEAISKWFFGL